MLTICYSLFLGLIALSYFAKDEGTLGDNPFLNFLADYLSFFAIPTFALIHLLARTGMSNYEYFSIAVFLSGLLYALGTTLTILIVRRAKGSL